VSIFKKRKHKKTAIPPPENPKIILFTLFYSLSLGIHTNTTLAHTKSATHIETSIKMGFIACFLRKVQLISKIGSS
jgi:hypothetical protein